MTWFFNRKRSEQAQAKEDRIAKVGKWGFIILASISTVLIAPVVKYREAEAAKTKAENNLESTANIQRAFVTCAGIKPRHSRDAAGNLIWKFHPVWENNGLTPAIRLQMSDNSSTNALPEGFDFPSADAPNSPMFTLGSTKGIEGFGIPKTAAEVAQIKSGASHFYIWGSARYRDVFRGTPEHVTRFAFRVMFVGDPAAIPATVEAVSANSEPLPQHNCIDEDCRGNDFKISNRKSDMKKP